MSAALRVALGLALVAVAACGGDETGPSRASFITVQGMPTSIKAGTSFTLTAELRDEEGNFVNDASGTMSISLEGGADVGFSGPRTVQMQDGTATFSDLIITRATGGLRFAATSGAITGYSTTFVVTASDAVSSASSIFPAPGNVPPSTPTFLTVSVRDVFGNPVGGASVSMSSTMPSASFLPTSGTSSPTGLFTTTLNPGGSGVVSVTATVNGAPIPTAGAFTAIDLCPPTPIAFPGTADGAQPCGNYVATAIAPTPFTFSSSGGAAVLEVRSAFTPIVSLSSGDAGSNDFRFLVDYTDAAVEWLLPAGNFRFDVTSADLLGRFTLIGTAVVPDIHQGIRVLASTGTYTGQALTGTDFRVEFGKRGDRYLFRTPGACTFTLRTNEFAPELRLTDFVTGASLGTAVQSAGVDAVVQRPTCRGAGTNPVLVLVANNAGTIGAYTLIVEQPPAPIAALLTTPTETGPPPIPVSSFINRSAPRRR